MFIWPIDWLLKKAAIFLLIYVFYLWVLEQTLFWRIIVALLVLICSCICLYVYFDPTPSGEMVRYDFSQEVPQDLEDFS